MKALEGLSREIRRLVIDRGLDPSPLDREGRGLDAMLLVFVKIATLHQQLDQFAGAGSVGHVEQELMRLGQALADEKDMSVRLTLRQALTLGQRRLKQHEQIDSQRRALGIKLSTLEMSFDYLRSHVFGGSSAEELALALDELAAGASFLPAAEAEVHASIAKLQSPVTRTVTGAQLVTGGGGWLKRYFTQTEADVVDAVVRPRRPGRSRTSARRGRDPGDRSTSCTGLVDQWTASLQAAVAPDHALQLGSVGTRIPIMLHWLAAPVKSLRNTAASSFRVQMQAGARVLDPSRPGADGGVPLAARGRG